MLLNDFYSLTKLENMNDSNYKALIHLNASHDIFKGHFPDNPVTPGVCMLQIIKEITEKIVSKKLFMNQCSNVKFMALINPEVNPNLVLSIEITETATNVYKVKNTTTFDETVALKLVCNFKTI
ncbi:3-hydroxyacyl-ACP dehydratase [Flavobacterium sp. I3-2]|uniref:3-hydroxyacyl-ACP dehydratase n=1 Tax=Flavobacterium sp. I3-2 TaxID=2748319 RepID=UPI0015A99562|nr:3-hydroxyacyl-ACP dehydratase [Flavobacterium sp. I3-2]